MLEKALWAFPPEDELTRGRSLQDKVDSTSAKGRREEADGSGGYVSSSG